jgi:hypothetical protein
MASICAALAVGVSTRVVEIIAKPKAAEQAEGKDEEKAGVGELVWSGESDSCIRAQTLQAAELDRYSRPTRLKSLVDPLLDSPSPELLDLLRADELYHLSLRKIRT